MEKGYTRIDNNLIDRFCQYRLSGEEWLALWVIIRQTWGWQIKESDITLAMFAQKTWMKKPSIIRALQKLQRKNIIKVVSKKANAKDKTYRINADFSQWTPLAKKLIVSKKANNPLAKKLTPILSKEKYKEINPPYIPPKTLKQIFAGIENKFTPAELKHKSDFIDYWTERNPGGIKERWQMQKVFDPAKRFRTWVRNAQKFKQGYSRKYPQNENRPAVPPNKYGTPGEDV